MVKTGVGGFDKVIWNEEYRVKIYAPPLSWKEWLWLVNWKDEASVNLMLVGVENYWEVNIEPNTHYLYYRLTKNIDITHDELWMAHIKSVYDRVSFLSCETLGQYSEPQDSWWSRNWQWFGGLFLAPLFFIKGKDELVNWWKEYRNLILASTGVIVFLLVVVLLMSAKAKS